MENLIKVIRKSQSKLFKLMNVNGVGVGYKYDSNGKADKPVVIVFVEKKLPSHKIEAEHVVPRQIEGVDTDVIEIGKVNLLVVSRTALERPAQPGISIGHYKITAGTFGAVVKDKETGKPLILSNNHILANGTNGFDGRAKVGDPILQPGLYDTLWNNGYGFLPCSPVS